MKNLVSEGVTKMHWRMEFMKQVFPMFFNPTILIGFSIELLERCVALLDVSSVDESY